MELRVIVDRVVEGGGETNSSIRCVTGRGTKIESRGIIANAWDISVISTPVDDSSNSVRSLGKENELEEEEEEAAEEERVRDVEDEETEGEGRGWSTVSLRKTCSRSETDDLSSVGALR